MRTSMVVGGIATLAAWSFLAMAQSKPGEHVMISRGDLKWVEGPPTLPRGAKVTVVEGDPGKEGPFTIRLWFPTGYRIAPHSHPVTEYVTVLDGQLQIGTGSTWNEKTMKTLAKGSFAVLPGNQLHYARCRLRCTIQLHGVGPLATTYAHADDDPQTARRL